MSSITPVSAPPGGARPASTQAAEALPRPPPGAAPPPAAALDAAQADKKAGPAQPAPPKASELQRQLEEAMAQARVQTNLRFRVDEQARRIVVSVIDSETGQTLLQIPDEAALAVARRLADTGSGLLDQQA